MGFLIFAFDKHRVHNFECIHRIEGRCGEIDEPSLKSLRGAEGQIKGTFYNLTGFISLPFLNSW